MAHSKRAVWLAMDSEHGNRLVEIAQEHCKLSWELIVGGAGRDPDIKEIYKARIEQLRKERDGIIQQFEGEYIQP